MITIRPGELFDFRMWNGWVMKECDYPPEYNHLYDFLTACLEGNPYEIDYHLYAKHYPILSNPMDQVNL
jgi:hypothetical protein